MFRVPGFIDGRCLSVSVECFRKRNLAKWPLPGLASSPQYELSVQDLTSNGLEVQ